MVRTVIGLCLIASPAMADVVYYPARTRQRPSQFNLGFHNAWAHVYRQNPAGRSAYFSHRPHDIATLQGNWHDRPVTSPYAAATRFGYYPNYPSFAPAYRANLIKPLPTPEPVRRVQMCDPYEDEDACLGDMDYSGW